MKSDLFKTWQKVKLGEILKLEYGFALAENNRHSGTYPVYGSSGIIGYHKDPMVPPRTIIVGRKGNVGSVYYSSDACCPIDTVYYIDPRDTKQNMQFLYYLLKTIPFSKVGSDTGVPGLNREIAHQLEVTISTDPKEQSHIASILSAFDDKIELNNKINATLEKMAQAIFKEWFVKFRFPGYENVKFVDGELGRIPEGWRVGKIGDLLNVEHGFAFPSDKFKKTGVYPVIKIKNIQEDNTVCLTENDYIVPEDFNVNLTKFQLSNGDILVAMTGATSGKIGLLVGPFNKYYLNQRVGKFKFNLEIYKWFSYIFLTQKIYRNLLLSFSDGSAQGNLSPYQIESIKIIIPHNNILKTFHSMVDCFYKQQIRNNLENQILASLRNLLLPKLMKGEVRV